MDDEPKFVDEIAFDRLTGLGPDGFSRFWRVEPDGSSQLLGDVHVDGRLSGDTGELQRLVDELEVPDLETGEPLSFRDAPERWLRSAAVADLDPIVAAAGINARMSERAGAGRPVTRAEFDAHFGDLPQGPS